MVLELEPAGIPHGAIAADAGQEGGAIGIARGGDAFRQHIDRIPGAWPGEAEPHAPAEPLPAVAAEPHPPAVLPREPEAAVAPHEPAEPPEAVAAHPAEPEAARLSPQTEAVLERLGNTRNWSRDSSTGYGNATTRRLESRINNDAFIGLQQQRLDNAIGKLREAGTSGDEDKIATATKEALDAAKDLDSSRKDLEKMVTTGAGNHITRFTTPIAAAIGGAGLASSVGLGIYTADQTHKRDEKNQQAKGA